MAWHLLRLAGANIPTGDDHSEWPSLAEFLDLQAENDVGIIEKLFQKLLSERVFQNPETNGVIQNAPVIREFLKKSGAILSGFTISETGQIVEEEGVAAAPVPLTTINNNFNPSMQNANVNGEQNQVGLASGDSTVDQGGSLFIKFSEKRDDIENEMTKLLTAEKDAIRRDKLTRLLEELKSAKTLDEKRSVFAGLGGFLKNVLVTAKDYASLAKLVCDFYVWMDPDAVSAIKAALQSLGHNLPQ